MTLRLLVSSEEVIQKLMPIRSFQLKQGRLVEIRPKPGESEERLAKASKQFGPNGQDRVFQKMKMRMGGDGYV